MNDRQLDAKVSVSPQIQPEDIAGLAAAGVTTLICNRPDAEVPPELSSVAIGQSAEAQGITFINIPLMPGMLDLQTISAQRDAIDRSNGRVLAYCASGTRSAVLWAFAKAMADDLSSQEITSKLDAAGYPMPGLASQLDQVRGSSS